MIAKRIHFEILFFTQLLNLRTDKISQIKPVLQTSFIGLITKKTIYLTSYETDEISLMKSDVLFFSNDRTYMILYAVFPIS